MQPASEKCSYLEEELRCKKDSLKENWFYFNQSQDTRENEKKKCPCSHSVTASNNFLGYLITANVFSYIQEAGAMLLYDHCLQHF